MSRTNWEVPVALMNDLTKPVVVLRLDPESWALFDAMADKLILAPIGDETGVMAVSLQPLAMTTDGADTTDVLWKKIRSQILLACGDYEYDIGLDTIEDAVKRVLSSRGES